MDDQQEYTPKSGSENDVVTARQMIPLIKGLAEGAVLWCLFSTLHVLSGAMSDTPGLVLLTLSGVVAAAAGWSRLIELAIAALVAAVLLIALTSLSPFVADHWVRADRLPERADAVVVLSGGLNPDTTISNDALDRLLTGLELVHRGVAPALVTTTVHEVYPTGHVTSDVDQTRIINLLTAVPVLRAPGGESTRDEASEIGALLLPKHARSIVVVTSPMHTRRACATFEALGFLVACTPARMRDKSGLPVAPSPENRLVLFGEWVYEVAAMAEYAARGWLRQNGPSPPSRADSKL